MSPLVYLPMESASIPKSPTASISGLMYFRFRNWPIFFSVSYQFWLYFKNRYSWCRYFNFTQLWNYNTSQDFFPPNIQEYSGILWNIPEQNKNVSKLKILIDFLQQWPCTDKETLYVPLFIAEEQAYALHVQTSKTRRKLHCINVWIVWNFWNFGILRKSPEYSYWKKPNNSNGTVPQTTLYYFKC